jgi:hypothetical protein
MDHQPHILIVGGAYAGISALNSLISFSAGTIPDQPPQKGRRSGQAGPAGQAAKSPPGGPSPIDYASIITRPLRSRPRYTLLDERDGFFHSVGAPLGQISTSFAAEFWLNYEKIISTRSTHGHDHDRDSIRFVQGTATGLDMVSKTLRYQSPTQDNHQSLTYDYLILATGMRRGAPVVPQALDYETYMADVQKFETEISQCSNIVLVGGGKLGPPPSNPPQIC